MPCSTSAEKVPSWTCFQRILKVLVEQQLEHEHRCSFQGDQEGGGGEGGAGGEEEHLAAPLVPLFPLQGDQEGGGGEEGGAGGGEEHLAAPLVPPTLLSCCVFASLAKL